MSLFIVSLLIASHTILPIDSVQHLSELEVTASLKQYEQWAEQPTAATSLTFLNIENNRIETPKELSAITPNFYIPDYGSKMTSSMYIRGIGARMEQPSMGMYIDNIPVMNKNNYDFDFFDIRRIDILRGPQGTLYGRNTIGGVINIQTLSAFDYEGTRVGLEYGNANTIKARLSTYQRPKQNIGYSIGAQHYQSDGFYTNKYNGEKCDRIFSDELRLRLQWQLSDKWQFDNTFNANRINQDGFSYSLYNEEMRETQTVNHNDPCTYKRLGLNYGTTFLYTHTKFRFSSTTSYQYTNDKMTLDQDFLPESMFTLTQKQNEHTFTQEFILKSNNTEKWEWLTGLFGFYKHNTMNAPVVFKQDGIDELILKNANKGIHSVFPDYNLLIEETSFPIESHFKMPAFGASLYHQSIFNLAKWKITTGIRFDYEYTAINYNNSADIHYRFTMTMPEYRKLETRMNDKKNMSFFEIMPRLSVLYPFENGNIYATIARGYKTGGFNTQIFSDILQNKMMNNIFNDLGVYPENIITEYDANSAISYKPEYSWNYELGSHFNLINRALSVDAAIFYIDIRNQQLTVFPPGKSTGRLMSNAGRTRSIGAELSVNYRYENFKLTGSYGYTNARFVSYHNGNNDFAGNNIPYAPQNTIFVSAEYHFNINRKLIDRLTLQANWQGLGKIYWNEENTVSQDFYGLTGGSIQWKKNKFSISLWGKNLTNTRYNTFYFKSMGNSFVQQGKPLQFGISSKIII